MVDYYQILEVPRTATAQEIKASYKRLAMKFHPDHNLNNPFAEDYFKRVTEAYRVLGDTSRKYLYDLGLAIPTPAQASQQAYAYTAPQSYEPYVNDYDPKNFVSKSMKRKIAIATVAFGLLMVVAGVWFLAYLNTRSARIYLNEANILYRDREPRQALLKITHALRHDKYHYEAYLLRAKIHTNMFNYLRAVEDYDFVIQHQRPIQPKEVGKLYFERGYCYYKAYDFENALKDFKKAITQNPSDEKCDFFITAALIKNHKATPELCEKVGKANQLGIKEAEEIMKIYCTKPKPKPIEQPQP
jgi:tetratricopeptide (TPR) repeat protein